MRQIKQLKLYNVIFPIWFLLFFPPVILITLVGNFIIDSIVLLICFSVFKISQLEYNQKDFYKKSILKVWIFGFLADMIGAGILLLTSMISEVLPYEITSAIAYNPFEHTAAVAIVMISILISVLLILFFNYNITFKNLIEEQHLRFKVALAIAFLTMPWTFLIPTKWFY